MESSPLKDKLTMLILSCEKFSDLWEGHIKLLETNWGDRGIDTYIVTDRSTDAQFQHVNIISAGEDKEYTERLAYALEFVKTEYVFITLDDYFLIKPVSNEKIEELISLADKEQLDYIRLFIRPTRANGEKIEGYKNIRRIKTERVYSVNLYPGIWRKSFMLKTLVKPLSPWNYEVTLSKIATEKKALCAVSNNGEFEILDVVRKGKLLRKPNRYLKKNGLYHGNREVHTFTYELKNNLITICARILPTSVSNKIRSVLIKFGFHFYRQEQ